MLAWIETREERNVRRTRQRHVDGSVHRHRALLCDAIHVWRCNRGIAVGPEAIGTKRVDGDHHEVALSRRAGGGGGGAGGAPAHPPGAKINPGGVVAPGGWFGGGGGEKRPA